MRTSEFLLSLAALVLVSSDHTVLAWLVGHYAASTGLKVCGVGT